VTARILARKIDTLSDWTSLVHKEVVPDAGTTPETYHSLLQSDYVVVLARLPDGRIPVVRQFRPAVEQYTFELPAGLVDKGESPESAAIRELKEETGLDSVKVTSIGSLFADTGRLENRIHSFFIEASDPDPNFAGETGVDSEFILPEVIFERIRAQQFSNQMHVGVLMLAQMAGFLVHSGWR
jgi:ADP-ribose pyrophosphatase